jgi:hypothetical protein
MHLFPTNLIKIYALMEHEKLTVVLYPFIDGICACVPKIADVSEIVMLPAL